MNIYRLIPGYAKMENELNALREDKRKAVQKVADLEDRLAEARRKEALMIELHRAPVVDRLPGQLPVSLYSIGKAGVVLNGLFDRGILPTTVAPSTAGAISLVITHRQNRYAAEFRDGQNTFLYAILGNRALPGRTVDLTHVAMKDLVKAILDTIREWEEMIPY